MKILKRVIIGLISLIVVAFVVLAIFISTLDLNAYKEEIQKITREQTGRDLAINGELDASFFPWIGISIGQVELSNAEGFGEQPFARMDAAKVKVEVLPLLRRQINVDSVELNGLTLDLQVAEDGRSNWDDLMQASASTSTTTDDETSEVEGGAPVVAAIAVGGVSVKNANISWLDRQSGSDAQLSNFNLQTGAIELAEPFSLKTGFDMISNSFAVKSRLDAKGEVTIDLEQQKYMLTALNVKTSATGDAVPVNNAELSMDADVIADLGKQKISVANLILNVLDIVLEGRLDVTALDTDPQITATLVNPKPFSPRDLFNRLDIEEPLTADDSVLKEMSLTMNVEASSRQAKLNDLNIRLDDTTFSGNLSVPDLSADLPPVRFAFNVDDMDLDRYLPPPAETEEAAEKGATSDTDTPIELPLQLMRKLDVAGEFSVDKIKVSNLSAQSIVVPVKAKNGVITLDGVAAQMYEGKLGSVFSLNAKSDTPSYQVRADLGGIQAQPLLADLLQDKAPLSGKGSFSLDIRTTGNSVKGLKKGLNGGYTLNFANGAINGVNIGYQLRRASAAIKGQKLSEEDKFKKTDFSALNMSGKFTKGILFSDDLDLRAPALRLGGAGTVDLNKDYVDYKLKTLVAKTAQGQGGKDKSDLGGVKLNVPIRGHFDELSADFTAVILQAMKDDLKGKLKSAEAEAKAQAKARLKAEEEKAKARLKEKEQEARAKLKAKEEEKKAELKEKQKEELEKLEEKAKKKLKDLFN